MKAKRTQQNSLGLVEAPLDNPYGVNGRILDDVARTSIATAQDAYEIRPRKDGNGVDLVSDVLRYGPIWYAGPDAVRNAVAYAKYRSRSRSHRAIIRVFNEEGKVTKTL